MDSHLTIEYRVNKNNGYTACCDPKCGWKEHQLPKDTFTNRPSLGCYAPINPIAYSTQGANSVVFKKTYIYKKNIYVNKEINKLELLDLGRDVIKIIFSYINDPKTFFRFGMTCKKTKKISNIVFDEKSMKFQEIKFSKIFFDMFNEYCASIKNTQSMLLQFNNLKAQSPNVQIINEVIARSCRLTNELILEGKHLIEKAHSFATGVKLKYIEAVNIKINKFFQCCNTHLVELNQLRWSDDTHFPSLLFLEPFPQIIPEEVDTFFKSNYFFNSYFKNAHASYQQIMKAYMIGYKLRGICLSLSKDISQWEEEAVTQVKKDLYSLFKILFKPSISQFALDLKQL